MDDNDVLDRIYEAAVLPELWPEAIAACARMIDASCGVFVLADAMRWDAFSTPNVAEQFEAFRAEGWLENNPRFERAIRLSHLAAVRDQDMFTPEEINGLPYFETMRRYGLGWGVGVLQPLPGGEMAAMNLERAAAAGGFDEKAASWLAGLKPHWARAALASARLSLKRMAVTLETLARFGVAAATLTASGRLLSANGPFSMLLEQVFLDRRARITLVNRGADALLEATLARLKRELWIGAVGSLPVPAAPTHGAMVVHVVPMRRNAQDVFSGAMALLVVSVVGQSSALRGDMIEALFDLTPGEARVCGALAEGRSVAQIAAGFSLSEATVRDHLKAAFGKCGVHRQVDLATLLRTPLAPVDGTAGFAGEGGPPLLEMRRSKDGPPSGAS